MGKICRQIKVCRLLLLLLLKFADCTSWLCNAVTLVEQNLFLDHACILFQWIYLISYVHDVLYMTSPCLPSLPHSTLCAISMPLRNTIISCFLQSINLTFDTLSQIYFGQFDPGLKKCTYSITLGHFYETRCLLIVMMKWNECMLEAPQANTQIR